MHQIFELFPRVVFGVHVDDLIYSAERGGNSTEGRNRRKWWRCSGKYMSRHRKE